MTRIHAVLAVVTLLGLATSPAAGDPDHLARRGVEPAAAQQVQADSIRFSLRVTDNNLVGITMTNYGFVGNNFVSRAPSLEYPLGTAFEHLVRGGLWIGARAIDDDGPFTGVSTAAEDGSQGNASQGATEYTPAGLDIQIRSSLPNDRYFNPSSVSEQDFVSEFSDRPSKRVTATERHRSMNILVRQENYQWSFSEYAHTIIFHYVITNLGLPLQDAWVGFYTEFASGPKNLYSVWPPSSAGSTIGSWFNKKWIAYDDSLRLSREHYCAGQPIPQACNAELVPPWIGVKLLGVSPGDVKDTTDKKVTFAAWDYDPGSAARDEDRERYAILSAGTLQAVEGDSLLPGTGDPVQLIAVGPFPLINPGDSIYVDFAVVGGLTVERIQEHSRFAQRAFDRGYIVPVPPPSPRFRAVARNGTLDLYWDDSAESFSDPTSRPNPVDFEGYRVYASEDRQNLNRIAQFDKATPPNDTTGFNTGLDVVRLPVPEVIDGVAYQYKYTIGSLKNGFKYYAAVTSYDLGNSEISSLESGLTQNKTMAIPAPAPGEQAGSGDVVVFPNPYRVEARWDQGALVRDHYLWFANLPERCTIRIYTLSGDLVFETEFDGATYQGQGTRGIYDPNRELDVDAPTLSGRSFGWNLISQEGQAVATGLYLYSVEANGDRHVGKFLIVKSDREDF